MKPWLVVLVTAVFSAVLIGGGVYWYVSSNADKEKSDLESNILDLENQKSTLNSDLVSLQSKANEESTNSTQETNTSSPTTNWKTYTENTVGYSIMYPTEYKATGVKTTTMGFGPSVGYEGPAPLSIDAMKPVPSQTLDAYIEKETSDSILKECKKAMLSGAAAYECLDLGMTNNYAIISTNDGYIFKLVFNTNKDTFFQNKQALSDIQKNMLDSFKFTK